jgi:stearoyl-CoA desaturase (delta-9 desaturase)
MQHERATTAPEEEFHDDIIYPASIPVLLVHLATFAAVLTGVTTSALVVCVVLYVVRMFGVTAGYHRYFSHRSFKTGRVMQFAFAFLAQSSAQRGILWWAAKHRHHHKHSDTEFDVHSPRHRGFLYSHVGWIFTPQHGATDYDGIPDLTRFPELVWLNRHPYLPAMLLALGCFALGGWVMLVVGFFWSTVLLYHGTFFINSLAHVHGTQRYVTGDDSRNNWWLALITLGEGWHNNHHAYQRSTRQGFRWFEIDPTFYVLAGLSCLHLVWDLGKPPVELVRNERPLGRAVIEKVARQLAANFPAAQLAARIREARDLAPTLNELRERVSAGQVRVSELIAEVHLPHLPTTAQLRQRAEEMFAATPSMDEIVARARELIEQALALELFSPATQATA